MPPRDTAKVFEILDGRGGRNDTDPPTRLLPNQLVEALNVDFYRGTLGNKRQGATALSTTFSSGGPFTGTISSLIRYVPGNDETAAELWGVDSAGVVGRLAGTTTFAQPSLDDSITGNYADVVGVALGGFLHLSYKSASNRSYVWDGSTVRTSGLTTPAAPTSAADGAGGLSFTRYYRQRYVEIIGSDIRRLSEASASTSTTIAAKAGVTVTKAAGISANETHWDVEAASAANGPWYRIARVVVGTTTYDDTSATIDSTNPSDEAGTHNPPPAWKYVTSDDSRLLGTGAWQTSGGYTTPKNNRVWYTPRLGSEDVGDVERVPINNWVGLEEASTGIGGPMQGSIYVFGYRRIWKFTPTFVADEPYSKITITYSIGCIRHQTIVLAEDENGNPALYFLSSRGPYRINPYGIQYLGRDNEEVWKSVNLGATTVTGHTQFHAEKHQVWWWVATGSANEPDVKMIFDTRLGRVADDGAVRGGWTKHTGLSAAARASVMFANTVGATMSRDLKPYIGQSGAVNRIWKADSAATDDAGTAFQAYVETPETPPAGLGRHVSIVEPYIVAKVATGVTLTVTALTDYGKEAVATGTVLLTAAGTETRMQKRVEGLQTAGIGSVSYRIGDAAAISNGWTLDGILAPFDVQERL